MKQSLRAGVLILMLGGWVLSGLVRANLDSGDTGRDNDAALVTEMDLHVEEPASVPDTPPTTESPATEQVAPAEETPPPVKPRPIQPGKALTRAFEISRGTKYGLSARRRSLKLPDKPVRRKRPKDRWRWTLSLGADTAGGNKDLQRYNAALIGQKETELNFFWLKADGRYGKSERVTDTENALAEGRVERRLTERIYTALDGHVFHDQIADLTYRARANVSLGRFFIQSERTLLGAEVGPGYVREKKGDELEGFAAGRVAQYAERVLASNVLAWQSVEYVLNVEDTAVYFLTAEAGLDILLSANMSLRFSVQDRYDNRPAEDRKRNDWTTSTSLNWTF